MKILIATGLYPPESGGPATYTKLLEERLPAFDISVSVLPFSRVRHLPKVFRHVAYFWKCFLMARKADVVFAQDTVSVGFPAALTCLLTGKKFLVRVPGDYAWEQGRQRFGVRDEIEEFQNKTYGVRVWMLRAIQTFVVGRAFRVVVPSQYMKKIVSGWTAPEKITVIYSAVQMPVPVEEPRDRPIGFLIVTIARLVPWKGVDGLMRVVAREPTWQLVIVGDGPDRSKLEKLSNELGVSERVRFTGQLPREVGLGWAKVANVFVLNSTYEGLSHVLIEVMSLGMPIVASSIDGNVEVASDVAWLVKTGSDEGLHFALKSLKDDPAKARQLGTLASERAKDFSIDKTLEQLSSLLKTL